MNAAEDGQAGIQEMGGCATSLFYQSEEGNEVSLARRAFVACAAFQCCLSSLQLPQLLEATSPGIMAAI